MKKTTILMAVAIIAASLTPAAQAAGPFGLFSHGCDSGCDVGCDSGCSPTSPCGTSNCNSCATPSCDGGCAGTCDSGCDSSGCRSCLGDRLRWLLANDDDCCPESCRYVSLFGGWSFQHDYNSTTINGLSASFNDGWGIGGALGRRFGNGLRGELETSFRSNSADRFAIGAAAGNWTGHLSTYSTMANLLYDVRSLKIAGITPYIGGGIGFAFVDGDFTAPAGAFDVHDSAFAYQAIVGGSKKLNQNVDLFAEYRYFATTDVDVEFNGVDADKTSLEYENAFFGIRINR